MFNVLNTYTVSNLRPDFTCNIFINVVVKIFKLVLIFFFNYMLVKFLQTCSIF